MVASLSYLCISVHICCSYLYRFVSSLNAAPCTVVSGARVRDSLALHWVDARVPVSGSGAGIRVPSKLGALAGSTLATNLLLARSSGEDAVARLPDTGTTWRWVSSVVRHDQPAPASPYGWCFSGIPHADLSHVSHGSSLSTRARRGCQCRGAVGIRIVAHERHGECRSSENPNAEVIPPQHRHRADGAHLHMSIRFALLFACQDS